MATDPSPPNNNDDELAVSINTEQVRIMQQILASDTGALSLPELIARNDLAGSSVRDILTELRNREPALVTTLSPAETPPKNIPSSYFAVTEYGINLLQDADHYDQIGILYGAYNAADLELPDESDVSIEEIENWDHGPTPNWPNTTTPKK